nr:g-type lectin s-receptor-like serine/threonine-protein kinase [Quercus suber]
MGQRVSLRYGKLIRDNETLVSPGGEFEFGFFSPSGSSCYKRYVGIWYKWDKRTVVWIANRDDPLVNSSGTFGIGTNGTLQVLDTSSRKVRWHWKDDYWCDLCTIANMIVNLTDSENLVLYDNETSLWESFKNPTDTFLPGMSMPSSINFTLWRDRDDLGSGNYTIKRVPLYLKTLIIYQGKKIYGKA